MESADSEKIILIEKKSPENSQMSSWNIWLEDRSLPVAQTPNVLLASGSKSFSCWTPQGQFVLSSVQKCKLLFYFCKGNVSEPLFGYNCSVTMSQ